MFPQKVSTRNLAARDGVNRTIIHNIFVEKGLKYQSPNILPELTMDQMQKRTAYCSNMLETNGEKIYETFFSDEMGIKLSEAHPKKTWDSHIRK